MLTDKTNGCIKSHESLMLYVDGGCQPKNPGGIATSGWVIFDSQNFKDSISEEYAVVQDGGPRATNNYAEYKALSLALCWLVGQNWHGKLDIYSDSKLLVEQVSGKWKINSEHLKPVHARILDHLRKLKLFIVSESDPLPPDGLTSCSIEWVPREKNAYADALCRIAYDKHVESNSV